MTRPILPHERRAVRRFTDTMGALQALAFKAVHGAALNAADAHPDWNITPVMARSIAKRAAGTLAAGLPQVLAAVGPSDKPDSRSRSGGTERAGSTTYGPGAADRIEANGPAAASGCQPGAGAVSMALEIVAKLEAAALRNGDVSAASYLALAKRAIRRAA